jgi:hypothetical protein
MAEALERSSRPVTGDDVERAVQLALATLREGTGLDWTAEAGSLDWTCWETTEHMADDLFSYAGQLGVRNPPLKSHVQFKWSRKPGGPPNAIFADDEATPADLLQVLEACGAMLTAMVRTTPSWVRSHHVYGVADPEGFAAMGIVETLVHTHDVAEGLHLDWDPPAELCDLVLARLFPHVAVGADPWLTLLWATGRAELPGRPRLTDWRWYGAPSGE